MSRDSGAYATNTSNLKFSFMYQRQIDFKEAVARAMSNYCCFNGRASRSEYWWFVLFVLIASVIVGFICGFLFGEDTGQTVNSIIMFVAFFLPGLGLSVRRLHDTGRSGWWVLLNLIPIVGGLIVLYWFILPSQTTDNQYGPVPNMVQG